MTTLPPGTGRYVIARGVRNTTPRADLIYNQVLGLVAPYRAAPTLLAESTARALVKDLAVVMPKHNVWAIRPEEY